MALVAGSLALSLTVTTTQKAEASPVAVAPVIAAAEAIVGGASLPLVMPSVLATSLALHPVGWAIAGGVAVAGLAIGAYYTKDYWLPWVQDPLGEWGKATGGSPDAAADPAVYRIQAGLKTKSLAKSTTRGDMVTFTWNYTGTNTSANPIVFLVTATCESIHTGSGYPIGTKFERGAAHTGSVSKADAPYTYTVNKALCGQDTGKVVGAKVAPPTKDYNAYTGGGPENIMSWGEHVQPGAAAFDPKGADVKYKTHVECIADDGTKSTITADWLGSDGGAKFPSCAAAGKGHATGKHKIDGYAPTAPEKAETLWDVQAPAVSEEYPQCGPERPGNGCRMAITIDGKPCVVGQWECENWSELYRSDATKPRVGCTYGPYTLTPDKCAIMEPAYRPGGAPATEANADGDPATRNYTEPGGQQYTPQQAPSAPGGAGTLPAGSTPEQGQCFPQGWSQLNPVEWVMKPVGCALDAAFKPKKDVQTRVTSMQSQFSNKVPISWFSTGTTGVSGGACPTDWAIDVQGERYSLICGTPADDIIRNFRPVLGAMLVIACLWPLIRSLFYSAIPVFKVTPS
jgi:hypothetical protein